MPSKKATTVKKRPGGKKRVGLTSALGPKATTILIICVMAGGIAFAARQKDQAKSKPLIEETVMASDLAAPASPAAKGTKLRPASANSAARPNDAPALPKPIATITGCLERSGDGFRLKDTAGESAPKSRSWKSGFLKKGAAPIEVVDSSRTLRLANQVGHRVTVSGTLVDREMRADALHQVASSCKVD